MFVVCVHLWNRRNGSRSIRLIRIKIAITWHLSLPAQWHKRNMQCNNIHVYEWKMRRKRTLLFGVINLVEFFNAVRFFLLTVADAWGRPPSGLLGGNSFDLGAFSQCLSIKRDGRDYQTQYCIGQLKFPSKRAIPSLDFRQYVATDCDWTDEQNTLNLWYIFHRLEVGPSVSLGICLPAACSIKHLESVINQVFRIESDGSMFEIPSNTCQLEENPFNLMTLDWITMYVLWPQFTCSFHSHTGIWDSLHLNFNLSFCTSSAVP